jgi:hypothetical protein
MRHSLALQSATTPGLAAEADMLLVSASLQLLLPLARLPFHVWRSA